MTSLKTLLIMLFSITIIGCSTQTFNLANRAEREPSKDVQQAFFVNGIGQEQEIDAAKICGGANKVAKVQVQQTFLNGILGSITGGIYSPRDARVFCRK